MSQNATDSKGRTRIERSRALRMAGSGLILACCAVLIGLVLGGAWVPAPDRSAGWLGADLGISMAVLALISAVTLSYVPVINNLSRRLDDLAVPYWMHGKREEDLLPWLEASWLKTAMFWTAAMHYVTLVFLVLRIGRLLWVSSWSIPLGDRLLAFLDWGALTSVCVASVLRVLLFAVSYRKDVRYFGKHLRGEKGEKMEPKRPRGVPSSGFSATGGE